MFHWRLPLAAYGQSFVGRSSLAFLWTSIPYRMEWRYHTAAHKVIAIDAGHVCHSATSQKPKGIFSKFITIFAYLLTKGKKAFTYPSKLKR